MAHEKRYTAKEAAFAVLKKTQELLTKCELAKAEMPWKKPEKEADQNAENQHSNGKANAGEIHPKEHVEGVSDDVRNQKSPQANPAEQKEGNNELAGTTPTQVGQDGKNVAGFDEMKGHIKLAKFIGHMESKRKTKLSLPVG